MSGPWVPWTLSVPTAGTYSLGFGASFTSDTGSSVVLFDMGQIGQPDPTPEPGTCALLLMGLPGLAWLRRRQRA
jgi:hypothetical protein